MHSQGKPNISLRKLKWVVPERNEFMDENELSVNIVKRSLTTHLQALLKHFNKYFPEKTAMDWIRSPFTVTTANHLASDLEDTLVEPSNDRTFKDSI